jgi:hypothetical protein
MELETANSWSDDCVAQLELIIDVLDRDEEPSLAQIDAILGSWRTFCAHAADGINAAL